MSLTLVCAPLTTGIFQSLTRLGGNSHLFPQARQTCGLLAVAVPTVPPALLSSTPPSPPPSKPPPTKSKLTMARGLSLALLPRILLAWGNSRSLTRQCVRVPLPTGLFARLGLLGAPIVQTKMTSLLIFFICECSVVVDKMTSGLVDGSIAGIMGLAFQTIASTQAVPFWQALISNNQFSSPEMSVFLTRFLDDSNASEDEPGGILTFGGTNNTLFAGDIDFQDFPSGSTPSYWLQTVSCTSFITYRAMAKEGRLIHHTLVSYSCLVYLIDCIAITVQGNSVTPSSSESLAAIDTGTTLIAGPSDAVANIWAQVDGSQELTGNMAGFFSFRMFSS